MQNLFFFLPTDQLEIERVIWSISDKNSSGEDDLSARVFMNLPGEALEVLALSINSSWSLGAFPDCLKTAMVLPLYKGGEVTDPSNFRPISLLSTLSKIIEKLVKSRIFTFLNHHNILSSNQYGFQSLKSTNDAVFSLLNNVYKHLNAKEATAAVFCDLSKAFDCVDRRILLSKLEHYGFRGMALSWFSSYLSDRSQRVVVSGKHSRYMNIGRGVPQGSVLGPILFLLYINDLNFIRTQGDIVQFADDTTILWHHQDPVQLRAIMSRELTLVMEWCASNKLVFNAAKTKVVSFRYSMGELNLGNGVGVQNPSSCRFLGITVDRYLRFEEHINGLCRKLSSGCYAVRMARLSLGQITARSVYFAVVESHLRYGLPFWGLSSKFLLNPVFLLQKRALRYIANVPLRQSCKPLFVTLRILTFSSLFVLETATLIHKNRVSFGFYGGGYASRRADDIPLPIPSLESIKNSIYYECKKLYNHLPHELRKIQSLSHFKTKLKLILLDRPYYGLDEFYNDNFESVVL